MAKFDNRSILYLHGYDASSQGTKPNILREVCKENRLLIPDLPLDPQECLSLSEDTLKTASNDTIIIGASLGGFYAYYLASKYKRDCILLNPVIKPSDEVKKMLDEETNLDTKKVLLSAVNMFLSLESNLASLNNPSSCFLALGSDDQIIDPIIAAKYIREPHIQTYDDDHSLHNSFEKILSDCDDYLAQTF